MQSIIKPRDGLFFVLALGLVLVYVAASGGGFPLDDSWIHQTYARNLAQYGEWSFIPGQPSAASTSPLYTLLLSIGYLLGLPYALWTHSLGVLALTVTGILGARMVEQVMPESRWAPVIVGSALVLTWQLIWAAASGMETMLFAMWTLWLMWLAWREMNAEPMPDQRLIIRGAVLGISVALITLTRPEGIALGGLIAGLLLIVRPQGRWRDVFVYGVAAAVGFAVTIAPYLLLNLQLTGGLLPNTAAAKFAQHAILLQLPLHERFLSLFGTLLIGGQIVLLPGIVVYIVYSLRQPPQRMWFLLLPVFWVVGLVLLYAIRLPAAYQHGRYIMPALPALVWMGMLGTWMLIPTARDRRRSPMLQRVFSQVLFLAAAAAMILFALGLGLQAYAQDVAIINEEMVATAHWIDENIPQSDLMAIHDIGAVGYFAPREAMLDIAGLVSPEVVPIVADADGLWDLMQASGVAYLMAFPDQIPGDDINDPRLCQVFITNGPTAQSVQGPNMAVYRLAWDENCDA